MKALLIQVNFTTGRRAGGLSPKNPNLPSNPLWQNVNEGLEIRLVVDGNVEPYRDTPGITVLENEQQIDAEVNRIQRGREDEYAIEATELVAASLSAKRIDIQDIKPEMTPNDIARQLHDKGALGIRKIEHKPPKARDMARAWIDKKKGHL